jgi:hypothetical protein
LAGRVSGWLARAPAPLFTAYTMVAAFATYFSMYAFRKPFAVGTYPGAFGDLDLKTLYIIAQVIGYAASKFLGIKVVSEITPTKRAVAILVFIGLAELALVLFAITPPPYCAVFLLLNGLPLGMIWGLVFGFLEGRKTSDVLGVVLAVSFIVSSGFVKTVGKWVLASGVPEPWMPAATGALFLLPLGLFVAMLAQVPPPTAEDEALRTKRAPMNGAARKAFFVRFWPGLVAQVALYTVLTAYRDFRDNFAREIWDALGYSQEPAILTTAEIPVAIGALLVVGSVMAIKSNRTAVLALHGIMLVGQVLLVAVATLLFDLQVIGPAAWMISVGLGLYVAYVPFNCVLFDRLVAAVGSVATAGFLIYVADAFGYLGSVALLLYKSLAVPALSWLEFFRGFSYLSTLVCAVLYLVAGAFFWRVTSAVGPPPSPSSPSS